MLQLNFDAAHDAVYRRLVKPRRGEPPFEYGGHPVARNRNTLAWARIDLDLQRGEALIEEIQSDWIREARTVATRAERSLHPCSQCNKKHAFSRWDLHGSAEQVCRYVGNHVEPHARDWQEAMLLAAIWLIREPLGIRQIFYHTWESGTVLKNMNVNWAPPKSLYTELPKRFCFQAVKHAPTFLQRNTQHDDFNMNELWL